MHYRTHFLQSQHLGLRHIGCFLCTCNFVFLPCSLHSFCGTFSIGGVVLPVILTSLTHRTTESRCVQLIRVVQRAPPLGLACRRHRVVVS